MQVNSATEDLTTAFGRSPSTAEIAQRLRITEEEGAVLHRGRTVVPRHPRWRDRAGGRRDARTAGPAGGTRIPPWTGVEHRDLVRTLLVQLPEREQRILLLRYYSNLTQSQISAELGVSQMHVSVYWHVASSGCGPQTGSRRNRKERIAQRCRSVTFLIRKPVRPLVFQG
ncbi:hypothetical protein GCM10023238_39090 [Streptomyces heliomycini]